MFKLNGVTYSLDQVEDAAKRSDLSIEEYVSKAGLKKVQEEEAGKIPPQVPGAPVEETAAPDTVSKSENTSLASQQIQTKPIKKRSFSAPDMPAMYYDQKPPDLTYGEATNKIKEALFTTEAQQAEYFGNKYFDVSDAGYIYESFSAGVGAPAAVKQKDIKSYFGEEKYKQYLKYQENPVDFFKSLPASIRSKYVQEQKENLAVNFFTNLPEDQREVFKSYTRKSEQIVSEYSNVIDEINKQTELYDAKYKEDLDNLKFLEQELQEWDNKNLAELEKVSYMVRSNVFAGNEQKAEEFEQTRNEMLNKRNSIFNLYKQAYSNLNEVKIDEFGNQYSYEKDRLDLLKKSDQLEEQFKNNKIIFENFGDITAASTAAAYNYDLYAKGIDQLKTSLFVAGGKLGALGTEGLSYLAELYNEKGAAEFFSKVSDASSKFANEQFQKHVSEYVPSPKLKDVKSISDFGNLTKNVFADQAANIATVWAGGVIGNVLRASGSAVGAIRAVQTSTAGLMGTYAGSTQHAQMDIAQEQANIALYGTSTIEGLYDKRKKIIDPVERNILDERIFELEQSVNLTELDKLSTAILYGVTETVAERLGSIRVLDQWSNMGRSLAGTVGWKTQSNKVLKQLVKGSVIEQAEETLTALAQNITSKYVAGDERVGFLDGINADLFTSTALTTLLLQAPSVSTTVIDIVTQKGLTEADRKEFNKLSVRAIELLNEKAQAKADGKRFKNNSELRQVITELGRNKAINFIKLQNLTEGEITKVFELQGEIESLRKKYTEIGEAGIETSEQTWADKTKVISDKINDLQKQKEALLENVFIKKYLGKDFNERADNIRMQEDQKAIINYNLGKKNFDARLTQATVGSKMFFPLYSAEEVNNLNISENKKEQLIKEFNKISNRKAFGKYVKGLGLIFNESVITEGVINNNPFAKSVYFHELTHWAFDNGKVDRNKLEVAADDLVEKIKSNNKIDKTSLQEFIDRTDQYKKEKNITSQQLAEELIMAYADLKRQGILDNDAIDRNLSFKNLLRDVLNSISPSMHMYSDLNTAEDISRFIDSFDAKVKENRIRASAPEEYEQIDNVESKLNSLGQKELNDRVDNLVGKKDKNGNYQWKSKEEFQNSEEFVNVYDKIINGNLIDPLIRRGIEGDVIYGKPIERFIEDVKDGLTGTIMRFDPTANNSLIGWINLQLGRRKGDVSNQYKKEFGEFGTTSIDIEGGEIGSLREIEAEDQAFDEAIDIEEQIIDETKGLIIPGVEVLGEEVNQELIDEIKNIYTDLQLDGKNYKTLPRLATKYVAEKAGVPESKITDPKKNLSTGEYNSGSNFLASIVDTYIKILPEGAITQEAASEALKGTSTGLPKNVLNFAYNRNEERFKDPTGLFVFEKRKDLNKTEFLNAIGLNPDGTIKPGITGRSPESQTVKALLNLLDRIITNTAVRVVGGELGMSINTQLDIRSGTVDGVYSLNVPAKQAAKDFAKFIDAAISKLNNYGLGDQVEMVKNLSNAMRTSDGPSGLQNFFLDVLKPHNEFVSLAIKLVPDSIFGFGKNVTVAKAVFQHTPRANAAGAAYQDAKGNRLINEEWKEKNTHKAFKYNSSSNNTTDNLTDIAKSLISNSELNKLIGVDFKNSKIISSKTRELVNQFDIDVKSVAPYNITGINSKNWQVQMEKFDSAKWKKGITLANRILQSIIIDITNHFDPAINKNSTQEKFDQWLGYAINIYQGTTNDSNGFRKLSLVDVDKSYMYTYSERNKRANALIGEHVPTNVDSMADIMIDNLFKRRISSIIPTVYIIPQIDSKTKDSKTIGLKNANDVLAVDNFLAKQRSLKRNENRIITYNRPNSVYSLGTTTLEDKFAAIISLKDARITPGQQLDLATAKNLAAIRKKRLDVITPGANDFDGLMYTLLAKGKLGEEQYEWMKKNLYEPYSEAHYKLNNTRQSTAIRLKKIQKENKELFKKLKKDSGFGGFTFEQALRVWLFQKAGYTPSGINEDTQDVLVKIVKKNKDIENLGKELSNILPMQEYWVEPDAETWQVDNIKTDVINAIEKVARKQFLDQWKNNVNQIFSKNNMNKLVAAFGEDYVEVLKDMLYRMETGSSRPEGSNKQMNVFMNWVRGSVATTMFFNRRSAVLQQISNVNFLNWGDNNPIEAAKAFANQKQYWEDFVFILNSDYLKERRGGLKTDINAAELAEAVKKKGFKGALGKLLQAGFSLTQLGDSLAIATGGSTFYRNRINTYIKQGLTKEQAEKQAFLDFQELSEETQQSARPDRLSQQQTTILGRVFLSFQNTPMQMTRLSVKAGKDLLTGRGDPKEKVFKMLYYGAIQSIIFSLLQTALIGDMFGVFEDDDYTELKAKKTKRVVNGVVDSFLKGTGVYGVTVATVKNALITLLEQEERKEKGKRPDYTYVLLQGLNISPPVGIKARNFYGALKNYEYNAKYVGAAGFNLNNPAVDIGSATVESLFNIPALSTVTTLRDINTAVTEDLEIASRLALLAGWHTWDLGLEDKKLDKIKAEVKEVNKQLRQSKKIKRGSRN